MNRRIRLLTARRSTRSRPLPLRSIAGRLPSPAPCTAASKWCLKIAREWSNDRVQWGQPVGKHDAVAQKIAYIAATAFGLEAMLDVSSRLADDKKNDIRIEAAIAKLYASESSVECANAAIQVHGGAGYVDDHPVERYLRDARVTTLYEGTSQIQRMVIAKSLLGGGR